jgi:nitroreductase
MSEEKKDPWLNYLALSTVILAVCATLSTFKGGGFSTRSIISQTQASDQWAFFQAKSVKANLYQLQKEKLALDLLALPEQAAPEVRQRYEHVLADYTEKVAKYEQEKAQIQQKAKALEEERNQAQRHSKPFGLAVIFLQIAILLSSIAGLFKRKPVWYAAWPMGFIGVLYFADGFFLFM